MIVALDELKKINVAREMPDVSGSSREVRKLMASFHEKAGRDTDTEPPKPEPSAAKTPESAPSPAASSELAPELQQGVEVQRTDQLGGEQPGAER